MPGQSTASSNLRAASRAMQPSFVLVNLVALDSFVCGLHKRRLCSWSPLYMIDLRMCLSMIGLLCLSGRFVRLARPGLSTSSSRMRSMRCAHALAAMLRFVAP